MRAARWAARPTGTPRIIDAELASLSHRTGGVSPVGTTPCANRAVEATGSALGAADLS